MLSPLSPRSEDNFVNKSTLAHEWPRITSGFVCCLIFRRPLCQKQTTTRGRDSECSGYVDSHNPFRSIIDGRCERTFTVASRGPALICKTIETVVTKNEMVEQPAA